MQAVSGSQLPSGCVSLEQHMSRMCEENPGARVTLAVHGMNAYRRGLKTRQNKEFRQKCLESGSSSPRGKESISGKRRRKGRGISSEEPSYDVSETDCQVALVQLQLSTGCVVKMCEGMADLASYVFSITKSLGASHFRKDSPVTFYCEDIRGPSKKDLYEASDKVCLIWKYMLNEFNDISMDMAAAVADVYPSPYLLLEAYRKCKDSKEGEQLLKDIVVRRGTGVLSSSRNLGPVQSKRIYTMMTSSDPNQLLD